MKTIKVVKSFEDALIAAFETGNMQSVDITEQGYLSIYGLHRDDWPEGKEAVEPSDYGSYKAGVWDIPEWAVEDKKVSDIPEDIKAINQLMIDYDCNSIPCVKCVFHDNKNWQCMLNLIREQTDAKYPGPWK